MRSDMQNLRKEVQQDKLRTVDVASDCAIEVDRHLVRGVPSLSGTHLVDLHLRLREKQSQRWVSEASRQQLLQGVVGRPAAFLLSA